MICEDIRELARRDAIGATLAPAERVSLDEHLASCDACRTEIAFEREIAAMLRETPIVAPSANFTESLLARLPAEPILLPELPKMRIWTWIVGLAAALGGFGWVVWQTRLPGLPGFGIVAPVPSVDLQIAWCADLVNRVFASMPMSPIAMMILFIVAVSTWGVTSLAEEPA